MSTQVGSAYSEYTLRIDGLRRSVADALQLFEQLKRAARDASASTAVIGGLGLPSAAASARRPVASPAASPTPAAAPRAGAGTSDAEIARAATAQARLALASGDTARAQQVLADALGKVNRASIEATNLEARLVQVRNTQLRAIQAQAQAQQRAAEQATRAAARQAQEQQRAAQEQQRAAAAAIREIERLALTQARLAASAGDAAQAEQILAQAIAKVGQQSEAGMRLQTSLNQMQARARQQAEAAAAPGFRTQFADGLKEGISGLVGPLALATTAIGGLTAAASSFKEAFTFKAELDATRQSVDLQLRGVRDASEVYGQATQFADRYRFTQAEMSGIIANSIPILRNSTSSFSDLAGVLARMQILTPGKSIEEAAFSLGELQSGDVESIVEQFRISRAEAYRMRDAIVAGGDVVQLLKVYLDNAGVSMDTLTVRTQGARGAMNQLAVEQERLKLAQAEWSQGPGLQILQFQIEATRNATATLRGEMGAVPALLNDISGAIGATAGLFNPLIQGISTYNNWVLSGISGLLGYSGAQDAAANSSAQAAAATDQATNAGVQYTDMESRRVQALAAAEEAQKRQSQATADAAIKTAQAQVEAERLAYTNQILAQVTGGIQSGAITAANGLTILQQQLNLTEGDAKRLIGVLQQLSLIKAQTDRIQASFDAASTARDRAQQALAQFNAGSDKAKAATEAARAQTDRALSAELALAQAKGDTAKAIDVLRARQRLFGDDLIKQKEIEAQIIALQERGAKGRGGGGSKRAAGAVKLTDQQKLNNQLFADQEKADDQRVKAAEKLNKRLLEIDRDYAKKLREQQQRNEVDKRQSRYDFYKSLTGASDDLTGDQQQALSSGYEEDFRKAQEMAQQGQAKLSQEYLAQRRQQRQSELEYYRETNEARKALDEAGSAEERQRAQARLDQLERLRQMQREVEQEQEKQLLDGGDDLNNDRQRQIDEAGAAYAEEQGKIADAADRSADRRITAAQRAGKAIDEEAARVAKLGDAYDRVASPAAAGTPATSTPVSTPSAPPPPVAAPPTPPPPSPAQVAASAPGGTSLLEVRDAAAAGVLVRLDQQLTGLREAVSQLQAEVRGQGEAGVGATNRVADGVRGLANSRRNGWSE